MLRFAALGALFLLGSCGSDAPVEPVDLALGSSDFVTSGSFTTPGPAADLPEHFSGGACERLGWINLYTNPSGAVIVYRSGAGGLAFGEYVMHADPSIDPGGHVNAVALPSGINAIAGTTEITSITTDEIRGRLDWTLGYPDQPEYGTVHLEGTFRSLRTGDECMPA